MRNHSLQPWRQLLCRDTSAAPSSSRKTSLTFSIAIAPCLTSSPQIGQSKRCASKSARSSCVNSSSRYRSTAYVCSATLCSIGHLPIGETRTVFVSCPRRFRHSQPVPFRQRRAKTRQRPMNPDPQIVPVNPQLPRHFLFISFLQKHAPQNLAVPLGKLRQYFLYQLLPLLRDELRFRIAPRVPSFFYVLRYLLE